MKDQFPDVMGMGDAAAFLRVSRQHVDRLVAAGKLRCKSTSTGKIFLRSDVESFQRARLQRLRRPKRRRAK